MSETQRLEPVQRYGTVIMVPSHDGDYCYLTDLLWERRQRKMSYVVNVVVVAICIVLSIYLVEHKHDPQPVARVAAEEIAKKTEFLNDLKANHERAVANVETAQKVYHSSAKDLERIKGLLEINANLKAQIIEQNKQLTPQQQTERLNAAGPAVHGGDRYTSAVVPSTKMHDGQVAALAREIGFTKIRVVE